jgi:heptosyltransferase-2
MIDTPGRARPLSPALARRLKGIRRLRPWLDLASLIGRRRLGAFEIRRIGVLLQWGIGDAVTALPLLHALHDAWPHASIEPIGKPFLADLLHGEPGIALCHRLVPPWSRFSGKYRFWDENWRHYLRALIRLRRHGFDLLVAPRPDPRDALQVGFLRAYNVAGFAGAGGKHWFTHDAGLPPHALLTAHRTMLAAGLARAITGRAADPEPEFRYQPAGAAALRRFRAAGYCDGPILAVSLGASHPLRHWNDARTSAVLEALAEEIGFLVIIQDPASPGPTLAPPEGVPSMTWRSGLHELKDMLSTVAGLFAMDSGVMHLAAAMGRPVVAIFGSGDPAMFGPKGGQHQILAEPTMPCRPCFDNCQYDRPICLDSISVEMAITAIRRMLSAS